MDKGSNDRNADTLRSPKDDRPTAVKPVFNRKGIGPNILLTAAAAVVPIVIIGVGAITSLTGRRGSGKD